MDSVKIIHGRKKTRGELRLPQLHFITMDQWESEIGWKAIRAWLKLYTIADRKNYDDDRITNSMENIRKILGVGGQTFYEQIIKPLWNYGFINVQETMVKGNLYTNIIVYEYPNNDPSRATMALEKIRDYDTEYTSIKREKAQKGVETRKKNRGSTETVERGGSTETVEQVLLSELNGSTETVDNNVLNPSNVSEMTNEMNNNQSVSLSKIENNTIKNLIKNNPKMIDRLTDIEKVYLVVKNHKDYNDITFISTLEKAIKAKIHVPFYQYFLKAIENNLKDQNVSRESSSVKQDTAPKKAMLPDWVAKQTEHKHDSFPNSQELDEEQKRQAQELLRALDELGNP